MSMHGFRQERMANYNPHHKPKHAAPPKRRVRKALLSVGLLVALAFS